jgi:hypothetical protein
MRRALTAPASKLLVVALLLPAASMAQEQPPATVHWAYSAYFGTGWYRVSGDRDVFVVRMTPRWSWSEPSLDEDGKRSVGLFFKSPVSVGLDSFNYDDVLGAVDVDNVSFLSVNPGIDIEIPVTRIWSLRPYASVGYGTAFDGSDSAWTYWAGLKSRVSFESGRLNWHLLNQAGFVGYTPKEGLEDTIWPVMAGLEFDYPVGAPTPDGDQLLLHWRVAYTVFGGDLDFTGNPTGSQDIGDQWEAGLAIARRDSRIPIWFLDFDMLGLGYRASSNGELKGVTFLFRSMFDL